MFRTLDQIRRLFRVSFQVIQLRQMPIRRAIAMRIVNVLVPIRPYSTHIRRVGKLLFVVVFVVPALAPPGGVPLRQFLPRSTMRLLQRGNATDVEDGRSEIKRERLLVDNAASAAGAILCKSR